MCVEASHEKYYFCAGEKQPYHLNLTGNGLAKIAQLAVLPFQCPCDLDDKVWYESVRSVKVIILGRVKTLAKFENENSTSLHNLSKSN